MARYRRRHDRHLPRSWFSLFMKLGGWSAFIIGALVVVVSLFSAGSLFMAAKFDRDGRLAWAVVTGKRIQEYTDSDGDTQTEHFVQFAFKVRGGTGQEVETSVTRSYFEGVEEQEERPIRYLVYDPTVIEEDIGYYRRTGLVLRWAGLVIGIGGLAALWVFGSRANRTIIVRRHGEKRYAKVTAIRELKLNIGGARQGRLVWREDDGQVGESMMHSVQWLRQRYKTGEPIVVFRMGRHVYWEGDVGPPRHEVTR